MATINNQNLTYPVGIITSFDNPDEVAALMEGDFVDLVLDDGNQFDSDAVRVEKDGVMVGYLCNTPKTLDELPNFIKSASNLRQTLAKGEAKGKKSRPDDCRADR